MIRRMNRRLFFCLTTLACLSSALPLHARDVRPLPADPHFAPYELLPAPKVGAPMLQKGDHVAICGDSITEQKRYSLIIETYLTACLPFAAEAGDVANDDTIAAGRALVPFDAELKRLTLKMNNPPAPKYAVKWGAQTHEFSAEQLKAGVNLAAAFDNHPLAAAFKRVWDAAARKQKYETRQMKELMHGPEGGVDMEATVELTEKVHRKLAAGLKASVKPVEHVIEIRPAG